MIAQSISQTTASPMLKVKGKVTLPLMSISVVGVNTLEVPDTNNPYELNFDVSVTRRSHSFRHSKWDRPQDSKKPKHTPTEH